MKERPILFQGAMVRAILAGTKTQTRRAVKRMALEWLGEGFEPKFVASAENCLCPYGHPGDRLWVRESFSDVYGAGGDEAERKAHVMYRADGETDPYVIGGRWTPSIHMPRWACRIVLEITDVRVERLQAISADDARAEGCPDKPVPGAEQASVDAFARQWYGDLWESINGPGSWDANPWVWAVSFRRITS